MIELYSKQSLITAVSKELSSTVNSESKPLAFLVGSPLSLDSRGGVPEVKSIIELIRREVESAAGTELSRFEAEIVNKSGREAYQSAFQWLHANLGQNAVNRVVRLAVLKSRLKSEPPKADGEPEDWYLPEGVEALGRLVCLQQNLNVGPILTTNFDPLLSLSIRKGGLHPTRHILHSDGSFTSQLDDETDARNIIYLHGYWRQFDTLHTLSQLKSPRPKLRASLRRLLSQCTLVVVAYSGWDDIFTEALTELLNDDYAELDVLWCFHEKDKALVATQYADLIKNVTPAIGRGRFRAYGDIDCHKIFSEIIAALGREPEIMASPPGMLPGGWEVIDTPYLSSLNPLREDEVLRYFNGAVPTWRHAISDKIPRREKVAELFTKLQRVRSAGSCTVNTILAAGGEGKTTVLLQTAADLARAGEFSVLWYPRPDAGIDLLQIEKLDPAKDWLLVSDDGDAIAGGVKEYIRHLHEIGRSNVHFLLAAREPEWQFAGGYQMDVNYFHLRGLSSGDAVEIVKAWGRYGEKGLKSLTSVPTVKARAEAFRHAVDNEFEGRGEGSFFGGLLDARLGEKGLRSHVKEFLEELKKIEIEGSPYKLFDALIYVAACHGVGIPGLHDAILADLVESPRDQVYTRVVRPLGEEAAGIRSARYVFTRHRKVAEAILVEADASFRVDLSEKWSNIVRQAHVTGGSRGIYFGDESYKKILHAGPLLIKDLPADIPEARRRDIAIAAAKESVACESNRLSRLVDLGKTYLTANMLDAAVEVFRDSLSSLRAKTDYNAVIRGYWHIWGFSEGQRNDKNGYAINVWITGISLSDYISSAPITQKNVRLSCTGLGVAFSYFAQRDSTRTFARALSACGYIGMEIQTNEKDLTVFSDYNQKANDLGVPDINGIEQAVAWLEAGVHMAFQLIEDKFIVALVTPSQVTFQTLLKFLQPTAPKQHTFSTKPMSKR